MSDTSFRDKILSAKGDIIYTVVATDKNDRRAFYCIKVLPSKEDDFKKSLEKPDLNLTDHGTIIASCYGEKPDESVKGVLKEQYATEILN
jgi:hypothetical protein